MVNADNKPKRYTNSENYSNIHYINLIYIGIYFNRLIMLNKRIRFSIVSLNK